MKPETQPWMKELIERIAKDAIELAIVRHDLQPHDGEPTDDAEEEIAEIVADVVGCLTGADIGCGEPEDADDPEKCALAFLKHLLAAHAPQQWIPVSERAPEIGQEVLVHIAGDILTTRLERVWCDGGRRPFEAETDQTRFATHWMPLPAPPVPDTPGQPEELIICYGCIRKFALVDMPNQSGRKVHIDHSYVPARHYDHYAAPRVPPGEEKQP